jgi:hypothetical protein
VLKAVCRPTQEMRRIETMKRIALSLVGGFAIPFSYYAAITILMLLTDNTDLGVRLSYPVSWPILVLYHLLPSKSFPLRAADKIFLYLIVLICNVLVYSIPTYFLLWGVSLRWRKVKRVDPPDPPGFFQH